jgi:hypothetical protein
MELAEVTPTSTAVSDRRPAGSLLRREYAKHRNAQLGVPAMPPTCRRQTRRHGRALPPTMMFVDWRKVNARFCGLIWLIAAMLAIVILVNVGKAPARTEHPSRYSPPVLTR